MTLRLAARPRDDGGRVWAANRRALAQNVRGVIDFRALRPTLRAKADGAPPAAAVSIRTRYIR